MFAKYDSTLPTFIQSEYRTPENRSIHHEQFSNIRSPFFYTHPTKCPLRIRTSSEFSSSTQLQPKIRNAKIITNVQHPHIQSEWTLWIPRSEHPKTDQFITSSFQTSVPHFVTPTLLNSLREFEPHPNSHHQLNFENSNLKVELENSRINSYPRENSWNTPGPKPLTSSLFLLK